MPTETTNYKLKKPLSSEKYDVEIFNENADKIEAGMLANYQAIQTKQNTIKGAASTITDSDLTAGRVVISNSSKKIAVSDITSTELGYLDGVTSNVQTQINSVASSVTSEANTRASADTTLQGKIDAEASARSSADSTLQANIDKKVGKSGNETIEGTKTFTTIPVVTLSTSSTATGKQLTTADWVIGKVNASATTLEGKITTEATARASGDSALQGNIDAEASTRSSADSTLQTNIDNGLATKVNKSGDTMTGNLMIQGTTNRQFKIKRTDLDRTTEQVFPSSGTTIDSGFFLTDKGDRTLVSVNRATTSNAINTTLQNSQTVNGAIRHCNLVLTINKNGETYASVPSWSVGTNDNSDKILTIQMANSLPSLVHTTGNEEIGGTKTFVAPPIIGGRTSPNLIIKSTSTLANLTDSKLEYAAIFFRGGDSATNIATIVGTRSTQETRCRWFTRHLDSSGKEKSIAEVVLQTNLDGSSCVYATTTPTNATSNEIATANWCLGKFQKKVTISTSAPSGGSDGDLWAIYEE